MLYIGTCSLLKLWGAHTLYPLGVCRLVGSSFEMFRYLAQVRVADGQSHCVAGPLCHHRPHQYYIGMQYYQVSTVGMFVKVCRYSVSGNSNLAPRFYCDTCSPRGLGTSPDLYSYCRQQHTNTCLGEKSSTAGLHGGLLGSGCDHALSTQYEVMV